MSLKFLGSRRGFHDYLGRKLPSLLILLRVEFNLNGIPNNPIHESGFCGEDRGIVEMYVAFLPDLCSATADLSGCSSRMCH
jgi:hypothetical protein